MLGLNRSVKPTIYASIIANQTQADRNDEHLDKKIELLSKGFQSKSIKLY